MTKNYLLLVVGFLTFTLLISSCKKDETVDPPAEFVATNSTFDGISTWTLGGEFFGMDPALGGAHGGNDSTVTRSVYFKTDVVPSNGIYPLGAVITKRSHNTGGTLNEYTAMVKRGGDFNPDGNNWEFFMLAGEGQIAKDADGNEMRGAELMDGMCIGCHTGAKSSDYIFTAR
ncbi:MAG: cytochrome P460 family protein [Bacteroidota bacterium]